MNIQNVIDLLKLEAKNNLGGIEENKKVEYASYVKGKGEKCLEVINLLESVLHENRSD
jgi:hypothetical protein